MDSQLQAQDPLEPTRHAHVRDAVKIGQWYWIETTHHKDYDYGSEEVTEPLLWCAIRIGSNYAEFDHPHFSAMRIHVDLLHEKIKHEPEAAKHLKAEYQNRQQLVIETTKKIEDLCLRLGISAGRELPEQVNGQLENAIVPLAQVGDTEQYKTELKRAKEEELPALFKELEHRNENLVAAMKAETLPLHSYIHTLDQRKNDIDERIFHVELYGGLCEDVKQISEGEPAGMGEHIKVLQRRLYMDEECLLDYQAGGMNFERLSDFDEWLAKPEHRDRILPFPRCMAAFRVRRERKNYGDLNHWIRMSYDQEDMRTYLALRNGENLYRLCTGVDFGEKLFPARDEFDFSGPVWAKVFCRKVEKLCGGSERDQIIAKGKEAEKAIRAWKKTQPRKKRSEFWAPYELRRAVEEMREAQQLILFSPSEVEYDEISDHIGNQMKAYNRIVLVLQGLLDRTMVFHPHPPLKLWKETDLEFLEPVFDQDLALTAGDKPDFAAYQARLNSLIVPGTLTVGQEHYFSMVSNPKTAENEDLPYRHHVYGDEGPDEIATVAKVSLRKGTCDYCWERETHPRWYSYRESRIIKSWLRGVPMKYLLNIDAYRAGDYKQFFNDPRTRAEYLQWAPLLLAAEDYKGGKTK
ncbi:MAG: hypothetical protein ABFE07_29330 [Armatimonadia bacterium]